MPPPIDLWFDFASPYGYFASGAVERLAQQHGRTVAWRPMLLWAVLKAQGIDPPGHSNAKWSYLLHDMKRTAAYMSLPFTTPKLPISAHLSIRLFYAVTAQQPNLSRPLVDLIFKAFMIDGRNIADPEILASLVAPMGLCREDALEAMNGTAGRTLLGAAVDEAIAHGVIGSPFIIIDGERFFGIDHLPQMKWFMARNA